MVEEVESHVRFDLIDLGKTDDAERIPLREILSKSRVFDIAASLSNLIPISFVEPRLELRD